MTDWVHAFLATLAASFHPPLNFAGAEPLLQDAETLLPILFGVSVFLIVWQVLVEKVDLPQQVREDGFTRFLGLAIVALLIYGSFTFMPSAFVVWATATLSQLSLLVGAIRIGIWARYNSIAFGSAVIVGVGVTLVLATLGVAVPALGFGLLALIAVSAGQGVHRWLRRWSGEIYGLDLWQWTVLLLAVASAIGVALSLRLSTAPRDALFLILGVAAGVVAAWQLGPREAQALGSRFRD